MKKGLYMVLSLMLVISALLPSFSLIASAADKQPTVMESENNVPIDKTWTISFNKAINENVALQELIYVLDSNNEKVETTIAYSHDRKKVFIEPPVNGYKANTTYTIIIEEGMQSSTKGQLSQDVQKQFTTSAVAEEQPFEQRKDSKNEAVVQSNVKEVNAEDIIEIYDDKKIKVSAVKPYAVNDILSLPPTEDQPFGYFRKIVSIEQDGDAYILYLKQAELEEYIQDIDISKEVDVTASDMELSEELDNTDFSEKYVSALGALKPKTSIEKTKNGFKVSLKNVGYEIEGNEEFEKGKLSGEVGGEGFVKIGGSLEFKNPKAVVDTKLNKPTISNIFDKKLITIKQATLDMEEVANLDVELYGKATGQFEMELGTINVPVASLGVGKASVGLQAHVYLVFNVDINGEVTVSLMQTYTSRIGVKDKNGKLTNASNMKRTAKDIDIPNAAVNLTTEAGFKLALSLGFADYDVISANITPKFAVNINSTYEFDNKKACVNSGVDIILSYGFDVDLIDYGWETEDPPRYQVWRGGNCIVNDMQFTQDELTLEKGKSATLKLKLSLSDGTSSTITLPSDAITLSSNNSAVKVKANGKVSVSNNVDQQETATIKAKYAKGDTKLIAKMKVVVKAPTGVDENNQGKDETNEDDKVSKQLTDFYKKSYNITNNSNKSGTIKLYNVAHYTIFNKNGDVSSKNISNDIERSFTLSAGYSVVVSYLDASEIPTVQSGSDIKVTATTNHAFKVYNLQPKATLKATSNQTNITGVLIANNEKSVKYDEAIYKVDGQVYKYGEEKTTYYSIAPEVYIPSKGEALITNKDNKEFNVFAVNDYVTYQASKEAALTSKQLAPGESAIVKMTEPATASIVKIANDEKTVKYNASTYRADDTVVGYGEYQSSYYALEPTVSVYKGGESIIENTSTLPIRVYGPSKYIIYEETDEKALAYSTLKPGESVIVNTTEADTSSTVAVANDEKTVKYNASTYRADNRVVSYGEYQSSYYTIEPTVSVYKGGESVIENTGTTTTYVFGPSKYISYEETNDKPLVYSVLQPGESVVANTTEPDTSSTVAVANDKKAVKYNTAVYRADDRVVSYGEYQSSYYTVEPTVSVYKGGKSVIENTGTTASYVFGPSKYISFKNTTTKPLSYVTLNPGESVKVSSTEPDTSTTVKLATDEKYVKYYQTLYRADNKMSSQGEKEATYYSTEPTVTVYQGGYTIIQNKGTTKMRVFGVTPYVNFN